jgi:hypothetical protein
MSRKPAFTELVLGRTTYEYPAGVRARDMTELVDRTGVCIFVVDRMGKGMPPAVARWIRSRSVRLLGNAKAEFFVFDSPRCPKAP